LLRGKRYGAGPDTLRYRVNTPQLLSQLCTVPYFPSWKTCYRCLRDFHPVSQRTSMHSEKSFLPLPFGAHTHGIVNKDFSGFQAISPAPSFGAS